MTTDKPTVYDDSSEYIEAIQSNLSRLSGFLATLNMPHVTAENIEARLSYVTDEMVAAAKLVLCGADSDIDAGIAFLERVKGRDIVREALETALEARKK